MYAPPPSTRYVGNTTQTLFHSVGFRWVLFFFAHFPLFVLMYLARPVATAHAGATFLVGLYVALGDKTKLYRVAYVGAYICGSEVLWRMAKAGVFWEFGKYATSALFFLALLRLGRLKMPILPLLYMAMLIPSIVLTATANLPQDAIDSGVDPRDLISFNMSGPLGLFVCTWFFSSMKFTRPQLQKLFLVLISPIVGIGIYTLITTLSAKAIKFTGESNFATSGGFGPNQVSSMLGLGAMLAFLYMQGDKVSPTVRMLMLGGMLFMAMQSAMTFSRGGLYNAAIGAMLAVLFLFRDGRSRVKIIFSILLFGLALQYFVIPQLDNFTGGAITHRFQDASLTGRDELALGDFALWAGHPVFGVGPGMAKWDRQVDFIPAAAHTEFTRLVAEHGTFGLVAFLLLLLMAVRSVQLARDPWHKALVAAMLGWAFVFMMNAAMRLVAPAFILGLTMAQLAPEEEEEEAMSRAPAGARIRSIASAASTRSLRA